MAILDIDLVRLPEDIEQGARGGPEFQTTISTLSTGAEQRNQDWQMARGRWEIAYGIDSKENYSKIIAFYRMRKGKLRGFLYRDWSDYQAFDTPIGIGQSQVMTGNVVTTAQRIDFALSKTYEDGFATFKRPITRPVADTLVVKVDNVVQASNRYTLRDGGIVRFNTITAPTTGQVVTASFEFDVPARFDTDQLSLTLTWENAGSVDTLTIVELLEVQPAV